MFLFGRASKGEIEAVKYLGEYKTFNNVESLNQAIYDHIYAHYYDLYTSNLKF